MTTQTQTPEERLSKLEGVYEQVNERLRDLTQGQANLGAEIRQVEANLRSEMSRQFHTTIMLIGALWASMVGGFIALFLSM